MKLAKALGMIILRALFRVPVLGVVLAFAIADRKGGPL